MSDRQGKIAINEGTANQEVTVDIFDCNPAANKNSVNVKTLERCFNEKIGSEMGNTVDTFEDRIQNANSTAIDSIITPEIGLAIRSTNASSGRNATTVMATSERVEHIGTPAPFENVSERNIKLHVFNTNDETRNKIPDEVGEMSVTGTHLDRQPHTHHIILTPTE